MLGDCQSLEYLQIASDTDVLYSLPLPRNLLLKHFLQNSQLNQLSISSKPLPVLINSPQLPHQNL